MYKKLTFLFSFLCLIQLSNAQEIVPKKTTKGFAIGGNFNRMTAVSQTARNINFNFNPVTNERTWTLEYQSGLWMGVFGRRRLGSWISLQSEFNILWCRQKTQMVDVPIPNLNNNNNRFFGFQAVRETRGTINFNNVYWQIPLLLDFQMDKATIFEAGLFFKNTIANNSTQDLKITTFSEVSNNTGTLITFDPPRVLKNMEKPKTYAGLGWILGVNYELNKRFSVRLRYEGGMMGVSDYQDLRENRMTVGIAFNNR
jgi:opacity protein-like surface antigen